MPIIFAQPSPVTPIAGLGTATDVLLKSNAALASIYEAGIRAGAGRGGGGTIIPASGGHIGGGGGGGYAQPEPRQRESDDRLEFPPVPGPDYVGMHIQERENERRQLMQSRQQAEAEMRKSLQPQPMPEFTEQDRAALDQAQNTVSKIQTKVASNELDLNEPSTWKELTKAQQNVAALQTKKAQVAEAAKKKAFQDRSEGLAQESALYQSSAAFTERNGYRPIKDLPVPDMRIGPDGKWYMANQAVFKAADDERKDARAHNSKVDLERMKVQAKDPVIEQKLEHEAMKTYLGIRDKVEQQWIKEETEWMKGSTDKNVARWTEEGREADVARIMRIKGFPGTMAEAVAQHKAEREAERSGNRPAPQAQPSQENKALIKQSDPEAVAGFWNQVSTMPRLPTGHPDLARSTLEQLDKLDEYYTNYKAIGVSAEIAAKWRKAIAAEKADRKTPEKDFKHTPPATSRMGRGAANIAGEAPYVGNRLAEGALKIGGDVYDDVFTPIAQGGLRASGVNGNVARDVGSDVGFIGETAGGVAKQAGSTLGSLAQRIERGGARIFSGPSPYDVFKRWLGK